MLMDDIKNVCNNKYEDFLCKPNVVGVCMAYKIIGGKPTHCPCICVLVSKKLPKCQLNKSDLIPSMYDCILTDVVEVGTIEANAFTSKIRPVQFGYSIGPVGKGWAGTAGALVSDGTSQYILSNNHVLAGENTLPIGIGILQPSLIDGGVAPTDVVANLTKYVPIQFKTTTTVPTNFIDAAIAKVTSPSIFTKNIAKIGSVTGVILPTLNLAVQKSGRTTELTKGKITGLNATITVSYSGGKTALFKNQIITTAMSAAGDSGSLVLDNSRRAVGLLFAGSTTITALNPITTVLNSLAVKLVV